MKKVIVIADVIMSLLAVGIIYADLRFFAIPKWVGLLSMVVLLALIVWEWIKEKRLWGKVLFTVINIVVLFVVFVGTYCNPYRNSIWFYANPDYACQEYGTELTYDEAKADLDQAMKYLKNDHPLFIHGLTADVQDLYDQALSHLQEGESISINDLSREIEMIFSSLGDGHTHVGANYPEYHYLKYIYGHNLAKDELVADEFIHYLDVDSYQTWGQDWRLGLLMISSKGSTHTNKKYTDLLFDGDVYVLTSTDSFSSAMDFAMLISDNNLGKIVGEPSGNKPRSYGDISVFKLKNSGLVMQVSTKKWYRVDESITDELIEPDIACDSEEALQVLVEYLRGQ